MKPEQKIPLKKLRLTLAFEPDESFLSSISDWVEKNWGGGVSLQIKVERAILAGAIVEFDGRYFDGSLRKKLEGKYEGF